MKREKRRVKIHEANHMIMFRGKEVRSPVTLDVTDKEFGPVMMIIKSRGIMNYEIEDIIEKPRKVDKDLVMDVPQEIDELVEIEEFESRTTLDKILEEK
jgi:hypothetical protein